MSAVKEPGSESDDPVEGQDGHQGRGRRPWRRRVHGSAAYASPHLRVIPGLSRLVMAPLSAMILLAVVSLGLVASIAVHTERLQSGVARDLGISLALDALQIRLASPNDPAARAGRPTAREDLQPALQDFQSRLRQAGISDDPDLAGIEASLTAEVSAQNPGDLDQIYGQVAAQKQKAMSRLHHAVRDAIAAGERAQAISLIGVAVSICVAAAAFLFGWVDLRKETASAALTAFRLGRVHKLRARPQASRSSESVT